MEKIGKGYYSPVLDIEGTSPQFDGHGTKREGEEGTLVAECILQDLACSKCKANIGLKCVSSPVNHVLQNDQILLRQAAVRMVSTQGRNSKQVELKVQRVLKLKDAPKPMTPKTPAAESAYAAPHSHDGSSFSGHFPHSSPTPGIFERMQAELDVHRGDIDRIDTAAFSVVSSFNTAVTRIDMELEKLNDTIKGLRRDLDQYKSDLSPLKAGLDEFKASSDHLASVKRLEDQIDTANETVVSVRKLAQDAHNREDQLQNELQTAKKDLRLLRDETITLRQEVASAKKAAKDGSTASASSARDIALLKAEMRQMREAFKQEQERASKRPDSTASYSAEEVQILSNSIAKLASRTNQVEALQMQFDLFKPRMQRLEGRVTGIEDTRHPGTELRRDTIDFLPSSIPNPRKRPAPEEEQEGPTPLVKTPSKRTLFIADEIRVASSPAPKPSAQKQARKETFTFGSITAAAARPRKQDSAEKRVTKRTRRKKGGAEDEDSIYTPPDD